MAARRLSGRKESETGGGMGENLDHDGGAELEVAEDGGARKLEGGAGNWKFVKDRCPWKQRSEMEKTWEGQMHDRGEFASDEFLAELAKLDAALDAADESTDRCGAVPWEWC